jgi:hypothetical protein
MARRKYIRNPAAVRPRDASDLIAPVPDGTAKVLIDIRDYLLDYLRAWKQLGNVQIRSLMAESLPQKGFRSEPHELADEGIGLAIPLLNLIASMSRVVIKKGSTIDGRALTTNEAKRWLASGEPGLRDSRYSERIKEFGQKGAQHRTSASRSNQQRWHELGKKLRAQHPTWSNSRLAAGIVWALGDNLARKFKIRNPGWNSHRIDREVKAALKNNSANTIRQWIGTTKLARKPDGRLRPRQVRTPTLAFASKCWHECGRV